MNTLELIKTATETLYSPFPKTESRQIIEKLFAKLYPDQLADLTREGVDFFFHKMAILSDEYSVDDIDTPVAIVREPINRFKAALESLEFTTEEIINQVIDELHQRYVDGEDATPLPILNVYNNSILLRPISTFLNNATLNFYKLEEHLDDFNTVIGLTGDDAAVFVDDVTVTLSDEQIEKLNEIYKMDIAIYDRITEAATEINVGEIDLYEYTEVPPVVPEEVKVWRIKVVAELQGILDDIQAALDSMPDGQEKIVANRCWNEGDVLRRHSQLFVSLASVLNLSDQQLDEMFIAAANLPT